MATKKMPEFIPCKFDKGGWAPCKTPADNDWCSKHEAMKCASCGEHAVRSCDSQMGGLACGAALCKTCEHVAEGGFKHITKKTADQNRRKEKEEQEARVASRTSPVQRMNDELGVPATLAELLKGDWQRDYPLKKVYFLELKHGLMGCFPAIFTSNRERFVVTSDLHLLERVWQMLEPHEATLREKLAYVNETVGIVYFECSSQLEREGCEPYGLLTVTEFERIVASEEKPFRWAFGLIGGRKLNQEHFQQSLAFQAREFDPKFVARAGGEAQPAA